MIFEKNAVIFKNIKSENFIEIYFFLKKLISQRELKILHAFVMREETHKKKIVEVLNFSWFYQASSLDFFIWVENVILKNNLYQNQIQTEYSFTIRLEKLTKEQFNTFLSERTAR